MFKHIAFAFVVGLLGVQSLLAYTYNKTTAGPLSIEIAKPGVMQKLDEPLEISTTLQNAAESPLAVKLTFTTIETIVFIGASGDGKTLEKSIEIPAKGKIDVKVNVLGKPGTLSVHYPIHLTAEWTSPHLAGTPAPPATGKQTASVVQPFESTITPNINWPTTNPLLGKLIENPSELPLNTIPAGAGLSLANLSTYRGFWTLDKEKDKPLHVEPVGWQGGNKDSGANASRQSMVRGGVSRLSLNMHPPYRQGSGNIGVEYRIKLPETTPISFSCYGAMRDVDTTKDNPTDGVTFRIVVVDGKDEKNVAEKHVAGTNWESVNADLTPFAGKEILLRLISDPGPKRDTTCDSSYWGDSTIFAGKKPVFADPVALKKQQDELHAECVVAMKTGASRKDGTLVFDLDGGQRAVLASGDNGFVDGKIALGTPEKFVVYDGIEITVKDQPVAKWPTTLAASQPKPATPGHVVQDVVVDNQKATLKYSLQQKGPALQLGIDCTEKTWITSIRLGPASEVVDKVYYGHGYCVVKPKAFTVGADGHRLSTSHVGFEYPNGLSVLLASTTPPRELVVDPERNIATVVIHPATTLTLLPGDKGMFDCAVRYRAINPKKAAPGVKTKAGRFCFDLWGGKYQRHDEIVNNAIRYGLTDSLVIIHSWQRYGYDNRLPDIWPPNAGPGTLAEMQATLKKCDAAGMLYGLHDNYIDFYPDAEGYSMDVLSFNKDGQPRKAWFNKGIQARSYQFRPDKFIPYLERNFDMMLPQLPQSCYFVDVFSSIAPPDFYDREGNLHTRAETLDYWGKGFDIMRERLTKFSRYSGAPNSAPERKDFHAPTISESGDDFLIGHLDGADCQFGRLDNKPNDFVSVVPCEDWERIPWFDAVNHTTFSLHGVGYSGRYEGGTGRTLHGIESDDYICSEILTGHPAMVDLGCATRGAVRKYWLLQDFARDVADCEIESVEFVGGDVHRQTIVWKSRDGQRKTTVFVNRGETDWTVAEIILPPYGFCVFGPDNRSARIYRTKSGEVVEEARDSLTRRFYVNGRQKQATDVLPISPTLEENSFEYSGENRFKARILWRADAAPKTDYSVFVHFVPEAWKPKSGEGEGIATTFGIKNPKPVTEWSGEIVTQLTGPSIPDNVPAGKYRLLVGMYDSKGDGHRARLLAKDNDNCRYEIGMLTVVRGADGKVSDLKLDTEPKTEQVSEFQRQLLARTLPPKEKIDFGFIRTKGAFLYEQVEGGYLLTPLPDEPATEVDLLLQKGKKYRIAAQDADGKTLREVPWEFKADRLTFSTEKGEFRYMIDAAK